MMTKELNVYGIIYKITNLIDDKSYIGQTTEKRGFNGRYSRKGTGIERVYNYYYNHRKLGIGYNKDLLEDIEKYGFDAFSVTEVLDVAQNQKELDEKEIYYINKYDSYNNGYNMTKGGQGSVPFDNDYYANLGVCQLTLDGKLVKVWDCVADIRKYTSFNTPNIIMTCKGINSNSYGYLWVFKDEYDENTEYKWQPSNNYKNVLWLDEKDNIIKEFISIKEAAEYLHIDRTTVRATCNHKWKNPKFKLIFKKEYMGEQRLNVETPIAIGDATV